MTQQGRARPTDRAGGLCPEPKVSALSGAHPSRGAFDKNGIPFAIGDVVKVFHFVGARRKRHYMYKQVAGERMWPSGFECWVFSHLNLLPPEGRNGGFYIAKDGKHYPDYEIVQCTSRYPEHFSTRPRDSDGNPQGGDGTAPSRSDDSAGRQASPETPPDLSSRDTNNVG